MRAKRRCCFLRPTRRSPRFGSCWIPQRGDPDLEATLNELGDTANALRAAQAELQTLVEERRRVEALAAQGANLEQAERRLAEYATTEEEIDASLRLAQERFGNESELARKTIAVIDERAKEQAESGTGGHQRHRGGNCGPAAGL